MAKHVDQKQHIEARVYFGLWSQRESSHSGGGTAGCWNWKHADHLSSHRQEAEQELVKQSYVL